MGGECAAARSKAPPVRAQAEPTPPPCSAPLLRLSSGSRPGTSPGLLNNASSSRASQAPRTAAAHRPRLSEPAQAAAGTGTSAQRAAPRAQGAVSAARQPAAARAALCRTVSRNRIGAIASDAASRWLSGCTTSTNTDPDDRRPADCREWDGKTGISKTRSGKAQKPSKTPEFGGGTATPGVDHKVNLRSRTCSGRSTHPPNAVQKGARTEPGGTWGGDRGRHISGPAHALTPLGEGQACTSLGSSWGGQQVSLDRWGSITLPRTPTCQLRVTNLRPTGWWGVAQSMKRPRV